MVNGQGTHCTGKTGKMAKQIPRQGKHREFGNFGKTKGFWFGQVANFLILKVEDISKFASKISPKKLKLDKTAKSVLCMFCVCKFTNHVNWHRENLLLD